MPVRIHGEGRGNDVRERNDRNSHPKIWFLRDSSHPLHVTCTYTCRYNYIQGLCDLGKNNNIAAIHFKCNKGTTQNPGEGDFSLMCLKAECSACLGLPQRKGQPDLSAWDDGSSLLCYLWFEILCAPINGKHLLLRWCSACRGGRTAQDLSPLPLVSIDNLTVSHFPNPDPFQKL